MPIPSTGNGGYMLEILKECYPANRLRNENLHKDPCRPYPDENYGLVRTQEIW